MNLHILAQAERARVLLMPIKDDRVLFESYLRLKDTPQGPRPFKFLIKKETERYLPPEDAIRMLRKARGIFIVPGESPQESRFLQMLSDYQLASRPIEVCSHCLGEKKLTLIDKGAVSYKGTAICEPCALAELNREAEFRSLGRAAKNHLARLLRRRRNLDEVLALLTLQRIDPELTRFDVMTASREEAGLGVEDLDLPPPLLGFLQKRLTRLLPVQAKAVEQGLLDGKSQLVVSATATGKSLVGEMAGLKNLLEEKGRLLFLVPLVALANQKFDQLSAYSCLGFSSAIRVGVSRIKLGNMKRLPRDLNSDIIVGTYEGIDQAIRAGQSLGQVGTVVIDEVHMLEDKDRGHRLAGMISRLRFVAPSAQFIYLSATVGNPASLARDLEAELIEYEVRPVPIERHLIFTSGTEKRQLIRQLVKSAAQNRSSTGYKGQSIVFTNSRQNCFSIAQSINGAAPYHAGLQYHERKRIEDLFAQGRIDVVVTTSALAAGVDFPASHVIFESLAMGIEWLTVHEFNQMLGRAGRPGYHDRGLVYLLPEPGRRYGGGAESEDEVALRLLHGQMEDVSPNYQEEQQLEQVLANACTARSRDDLEMLHSRTIGLDDLDRSLSTLAGAGLVRGIEPTRLGRAAAAHFLSPVQVGVIGDGLRCGLNPLEIAVELETFQALFLKAADRISVALHTRISQRVLHGSFYDLINSPELRTLENKIQQQCLDFARDFMRCTCRENPYCGCVEKRVSERILELRMEGKSPQEIIREFSDRYGIYAYQGDLINYLDQAVRYLEAVEAVARVTRQEGPALVAARARELVEGD